MKVVLYQSLGTFGEEASDDFGILEYSMLQTSLCDSGSLPGCKAADFAS